MNFTILTVKEAKNLDDFVNYWSSIYSNPLEHLYSLNIDKASFDKTNIRELFKWKNGMSLSDRKTKSLEKNILSKKEIIDRLKSQDDIDLQEFRELFKNVSAVWKIFLLHIISPKKYPIYDQHVHRAYAYLNNLDFTNISPTLSNKQKEQFYFDKYLAFVEGLAVKNVKKMDEAFFSFGQFINPKRNKYYQLLTNNH